jgi:hypothetical protein
MVRRVAYLAVAAGMAMLVAGCALNFLSGERRASWRDDEERACLRAREVVETASIQRVKEINGRGACGIDRPLKVSAFEDGQVSIGPSATLGCPMTAALERWLQTSVQPAAIAWFGMPVVELKQMGTYSCRTRNNIHGAKLSEHAFGNALDIGAFKLADGRVVKVKGEFLYGVPEAQGFLREVFAGACAQFKTVLGPGAPYHGDHFHLDLAHHNADGTSRYCKPTPSGPPPMRPPYRGDRMAGYPASPGPLLTQAPPDAAADMSDPFGVAAAQESGALPAGARVTPVYRSGEDSYGQQDPYGVAEAPSYPPAAQDDQIGGDYGDIAPAYPTPDVAIAQPPSQPQWRAEAPRRKQGFFSWLFNPKPPADIPLSYAPR